MITYTVWYKNDHEMGWNKVERVKADDWGPELKMRILITEDNERYEIPTSCAFRFSKDRFLAITEEERKRVSNDIQG